MAGNVENGGGWRGSPWRIAAWAMGALILLLPLVAMQFTDEVNWGVADFAIAGALVIGTGIAFELAVRWTGSTAYRAAAGVALAAAFGLVWLSIGVGIIGRDGDPANLMYFGVLAVAIIGAIIARFKPGGMARALFATALAQVVVAVIALAARLGSTTPRWPLDIVGLTMLFVAMFVGSGLLFRIAAREQSS